MIVLPVIFVILFYAEEDWRGARMLADAQARWKAAGLSLDPASYIPPPVPDNQNLAALPEFQWEPAPTNPKEQIPKRLIDAFDPEKHGGPIVNFAPNDDLVTNVKAAYAKMFPGKTPPASAAAQLEQLYPFIVELRTAATTRPLFRLNEDYTSEPVWNRSLALVGGQLKVAKFLSYHAKLALKENQPEVAAEDIRIGLQIARGVGQEPTLVSGLVSIGLVAIMRGVVVDGLKSHEWPEAELAALATEFGSIDGIALGQHLLAGEETVFGQVTISEMRGDPAAMATLISNTEERRRSDMLISSLVMERWPRGWWDSNAAQMLDYIRRAVGCLDPKSRQFDVRSFKDLQSENESLQNSWAGCAPWNILACISTGPVINTDKLIAREQVADDEACIACALERYRLGHGAYPAALDALVPAYIDALPHDVMNGEPFHYRVNGDGTFLLYSVGWDQKDDGGVIAYRDPSSTSIDFDHGDWVWPMMVKGQR